MEIIQAYLDAFVAKDITAIAAMFADNIVLQDPFVGIVQGKDAVLAVYEGMFQTSTYTIDVIRIMQDGNVYNAQFSLGVIENAQKTIVDGVDVITLDGDKITSIRAYLDTSEFIQ